MEVIILLALLIITPGGSGTDVSNLIGQADFRSVRLQWKYPASDPGNLATPISGFVVTYCEDQAWGKYRCKKKVLDEITKNEIKNTEIGSPVFETDIERLRMATNYTIEVSPTFEGDQQNRNRARKIGSFLKIQTKGFSARAIRCLSNSSLVEIETGPYFSGKISVEGTTSKKCATQGDYLDPKTSYFLKIDHRLCGSNVFNSSVKTFIIVQENLPILTHSTRRFMVVCTYVPETFTVRAGVNLPDESEADYASGTGNELVQPIGQSIFEYDVSEYLDQADNNRLTSRASKQVGRAMRFSTEAEDEEPRRMSHLVLMVVMVIAATVGMVIAVWQFVHRMRKSNRSGFMSPQAEPTAIAVDENMDAVVRDFADTLSECQAGRLTPGPPVALDELSVLDIEDDHSYASFDPRTPDGLPLDDRLTPIFINNDSQEITVNGLGCTIPTDCYFTCSAPPQFSGPLLNDFDHSLQLLSIASADIPGDPMFGEPRGILVPDLNLSNVLEAEEPLDDHSILSAINPFIRPFPVPIPTPPSGLPKDSDDLITQVNFTKSRLSSSFRAPKMPTFETTVLYQNVGKKKDVQQFSEDGIQAEDDMTSDDNQDDLSDLSQPNSLPAPIDTNWQLRDDDGQIFPSLAV